MSQRTALILSALLTAFALVVVGAVAGRAGQAAATTDTQAAEAAPGEVASETASPDLAAYQAREAEYQALVEQANQRLEKAYAQLRAQQAAAPTPTAGQALPISFEQAAALALQASPGAVLTGQPGLVAFQGVTAYEVPLDRGLVYVDAQTGQILYNGTLAPAAPVASSGGNSGAQGGFVKSGGGEHHESEKSDNHPEQEGHDD